MPRTFTKFFDSFQNLEADRTRPVGIAGSEGEDEAVISKLRATPDYYSRKQLKHARNAALSAELWVFCTLLAMAMRIFGW